MDFNFKNLQICINFIIFFFFKKKKKKTKKQKN